MRVLILRNVRSGRGRSARVAADLERALARRGHSVSIADAGSLAAGAGRLAAPRHEAILAVGGDGTVHHALADLVAGRVPVYHVPAGTENLFAREFGMSADAGEVVRALERRRVVDTDLGSAGGRLFAIMASVGPDAGVIHRLGASRGRAAGHMMYLSPVLDELLHPHLAALHVRLDGKEIAGGRRGLLVVANSRQYGMRLDPAKGADIADGLLDVVFLPGESSASMLAWGVRCLTESDLASAGAAIGRGREVVVSSGRPAPWQADGEPVGWIEPGSPLSISVRPGALGVIAP